MAVRTFQRISEGITTEPRLRLFCFPHAGAGAALFRTWPDDLPDGIEVVCPCLPGRDARAAEAPLAEMAPLVADLADQISVLLDRPYALYGHSLGAFVAFDLGHELARRGAPEPSRLIVSGQRGPSLPYDRTPIYPLPDDAFVAGVSRRHNAIPAAILADPAMMAYLTRILRADFTLVEAYRRPGVTPLSCPISVYGGADDPMVRREQLQAWALETSGLFSLRMVPGSHFFPQSHQAELLALISGDLV